MKIIKVICSKCNQQLEISSKTYNRNIRKNGYPYLCSLCRNKSRIRTEEQKKKISESIKEKYKNINYRKSQKDGIINKYKDKEYRNKIKKIIVKSNKDKSLIDKRRVSYYKALASGLREKKVDITTKLWKSSEFRKSVVDGMMKDDVRLKMAIGRSKQKNKSSREDALARMLDGWGVSYQRQVWLGYYHWDFLILRDNRNLLIEVMSDYWHRKVAHVMKNDKSKKTYFDRYLSQDYELMYLWEHEFLCLNRIRNRIKGHVEISKTDFNFDQVSIRVVDSSQCKVFLSLFHYLKPKIAGYKYGAFLGDKLIAVCVFSNPVRIESVTSLNMDYKDVLELSRFCIASGYNKKNFASWFLSKCRRIIHKESGVKALIAFSDLTVNHNGIIYKADNWKRLGTTPVDYWYVGEDGSFMHKRTLYGHAVRLKMKEKEFAEKYCYDKVYGKEKIKYVSWF